MSGARRNARLIVRNCRVVRKQGGADCGMIHEKTGRLDRVRPRTWSPNTAGGTAYAPPDAADGTAAARFCTAMLSDRSKDN